MKKRIYDYIKSHESSDCNTIAEELNLEAIHVLETILELESDGYIKVLPPKPLSLENNSSCFYVATGKDFQD